MTLFQSFMWYVHSDTCPRRLKFLEAKYNLHILLNESEELAVQKVRACVCCARPRPWFWSLCS